MDREQKIHDIAIAIIRSTIIPEMAANSREWDRDACRDVAIEYESIVKLLHEYKFS